jgi:hypothetical protein
MGSGGKRVGAGRPKVDEPRRLRTIRMPDSKWAAYTETAARRGVGLSDWIETTLDKEAAMDNAMDSVDVQAMLYASYYASPSLTIYAVITGQPEESVRVGCGKTPRQAYADALSTSGITPFQSEGPAGEAERRALDWALSEDHAERAALEAINVGADDLNDDAKSWL